MYPFPASFAAYAPSSVVFLIGLSAARPNPLRPGQLTWILLPTKLYRSTRVRANKQVSKLV